MSQPVPQLPPEQEARVAAAEAAIADDSKKRLSRRKFLLRVGGYGVILLTAGNGFLEPYRFRITRRTIGNRGRKIVHLTDLHYKGGRRHLERVVAAVNREAPDAVLCTGDFIEDAAYLPEALDILSQLTAPLYAVPGNHDYWANAPFADIAACCEKTGGRWLEDSEFLHDGWLHLTGVTDTRFPLKTFPPHDDANVARILLTHYPAVADTVLDRKFDLILAGHSHGGQIRLPGIGALLLPHNVGTYDLGWFETPGGLLHVSAGIGTYFVPIRFLCRPDFAVIKL